MNISGPQYSYGLKARLATQGVNTSGNIELGTASRSYDYPTPPDIAYSLAVSVAAGSPLTIDFETGIVTGTVAGVNQKETSTIVAASGCTSDGNLELVIAAAGLAGSPLAVNVPLTTSAHTSQNLIAAQCRTTLAATPAITDFFTVGGTTNTFTLEKLAKQANDPSFSMAVPGTRGVTAEAASANTTAGVATSMAYRISGAVWDAVDAEGVALPAATKLYGVLIQATAETPGASIGVSSASAGNLIWPAPMICEQITTAGDNLWIDAAVAFSVSSGQALIYLDVHAGT